MEIHLEDRFFIIEIRFCFSCFNAKSEICISKFQSKFTNRKHPEPWNALLTSKEEEARKGALKIVRLITPLPAYHGWRGSPAAVEKQAIENWEALAADRPTWHSAVSSDARLAEKKMDSGVQKQKSHSQGANSVCNQYSANLSLSNMQTPLQVKGRPLKASSYARTLTFLFSIFEVSWSLSNTTDEQLPLIKSKGF